MRERIKNVLTHYGSNITRFCKENNLTVSTYCRQMNGEAEVSLTLLNAILVAYPKVSADWLLLGIGTMERDSITEPKKEPSNHINMTQTVCPPNVDSLQETISEQQKTINKLTDIITNLVSR